MPRYSNRQINSGPDTTDIGCNDASRRFMGQPKRTVTCPINPKISILPKIDKDLPNKTACVEAEKVGGCPHFILTFGCAHGTNYDPVESTRAKSKK
ncbi:MAG: hypothetical protein WCF94_00030 [bacterium]